MAVCFLYLLKLTLHYITLHCSIPRNTIIPAIVVARVVVTVLDVALSGVVVEVIVILILVVEFVIVVVFDFVDVVSVEVKISVVAVVPGVVLILIVVFLGVVDVFVVMLVVVNVSEVCKYVEIIVCFGIKGMVDMVYPFRKVLTLQARSRSQPKRVQTSCFNPCTARLRNTDNFGTLTCRRLSRAPTTG